MSWTEDGSGNITITGNEIRYTSDKKSNSPTNALWSRDCNTSRATTGYWEFVVSDTSTDNADGGGGGGTIWIGLSTTERFGAGYRMKGLLYGSPSGNLGDGSSLVISGWGPRYADGDIIGMRLETIGDRTTVAYSKNGVGLGMAFDIVGWDEEEDYRPAVSLSIGQSVTISEDVSIIPDIESMSRPGISGEAVEGDWVGKFALSVVRIDSDKWRVVAKAGNTLSCIATQENDGTMTTSPVASTRMGRMRGGGQLEQDADNLLQSLVRIQRDGPNLVLKDAEGDQEVFEQREQGSAGRNMINWMRK